MFVPFILNCLYNNPNNKPNQKAARPTFSQTTHGYSNSRLSGSNRRPTVYDTVAPPAIALADSRSRTDNLSLTKGLLCQLSYIGLGHGGQVYQLS